MYRGETVAVVVPAYNEEDFVAGVVETVPEFVDRVYAVDDDSTDDTWREIREAARRVNEGDRDGPFEKRVVPIRHDENRGVGGAIKTGYLRAREDEIDVTAVMGGDGQMRPEALELIVDPVATGEADYAKGNRLVDEEFYEDMPQLRYVGNRVLTTLTKIASGYWAIEDPQNGYTAISLSALETVEIEEMYEFYGYCNDLLVKLNVEGMEVVDVPRQARYDDEESHIQFSTYVPKVSGMLARNTVWRFWQSYVVKNRHPIALVAGIAALTGFGSLRRVARRIRGEDANVLGIVGAFLLTSLATLALDRRQGEDLAEQTELREDVDLDGVSTNGEVPSERAVSVRQQD